MPRTPRWLFLSLLLLPAALGAQENGFSIGLGAEADLITTDTWGIGGLFLLDYRFNKLFAAGVQGEVSFSHLAEGGNAGSPEGLVLL
ncbi:hypothetical protein AGMMS49944_26510 [Spirochaetia bacterium]|nr:hypothetical protein AGMMS49944_26510 [Spirochaetia bacterium]